MKIDKTVFSKKLQELMDANQVSNYALAKVLGCSQSSIANWLEGKTKPGAGYVNLLVDFFGVNLWELIGMPDGNTSQRKSPISKAEQLTDAELRTKMRNLPAYAKFQITNIVDLAGEHPDRAKSVLDNAVNAFGDSNWAPDNEKSPGLSTEAAQLASDYDDMDKWGKKAVRSIADTELSRIMDVDELDQDEDEIIQFRPRVKQIPQLGTSFAAGAGEVDTGNAWSMYTVPEDSPADFAIRITGDSMEPYLEDGSIALCVRRNPKDTEVGAFLIDGDFICKQMCIDYNGMLHLFSLNRDRKNLDRHIPRDDIDRQIMCFGTVLMDKVPSLPID